jgi:predicted phosphohydrolase
MRIVCLSDTHTRHARIAVPDGDLLVHTGDFSGRGKEGEIRAFDAWLGTLPHRHKVIIAGNHDFAFEDDPSARGWIQHAVYLEDEGLEIEGLRIWGSPWQPRFFDWAFNLDRGAPLRAVWAKIPEGIDILLTHGPPHRILDRTARGQEVGCEQLREAVFRVRPQLHVFGHIHEAHGEEFVDGVQFVNASCCNLDYRPTQAPIVVDITPRTIFGRTPA